MISSFAEFEQDRNRISNPATAKNLSAANRRRTLPHPGR